MSYLTVEGTEALLASLGKQPILGPGAPRLTSRPDRPSPGHLLVSIRTSGALVTVALHCCFDSGSFATSRPTRTHTADVPRPSALCVHPSPVALGLHPRSTTLRRSPGARPDRPRLDSGPGAPAVRVHRLGSR
jgi:hypothetical protein